MKRWIKLLLAALMALAMIGMALTAGATGAGTSGETGSSGESQGWILTDGVLTISDDRAMLGCSYSSSPWNRDDIKEVIIKDGVTSIVDYAFCSSSSLSRVTISESVNSIGESAFSGCNRLYSITIPGTVSDIKSWAFYRCSSLVSVTIQDGVSNIGSYAFAICSSLPSITIPSSVSSVGTGAFLSCDRLSNVSFYGMTTTIAENAISSHPTVHCYRNSIAESWANGQNCNVNYIGEDDCEHNWATRVVVYGNICTSQSAEVEYCTICDEVRSVTLVPPLGHIFGNSVIVSPGSCTTPGIVRKDCLRCTYSITESVQGEHQWIEDRVIRDATCVTPGNVKLICSICGETDTVDTPMLDHSFDLSADSTTVSQRGTCQNDGTYSAVCAVCGGRYEYGVCVFPGSMANEDSDNVTVDNPRGTQILRIPARGHLWSEPVIIRQVTYQKDGLLRCTCQNSKATILYEPCFDSMDTYLFSGEMVYDERVGEVIKKYHNLVEVVEFQATEMSYGIYYRCKTLGCGYVSNIIRYLLPSEPYDGPVLTLPESLTSIEAEAFEGCAAHTVVIPEGCVSIGDRAFADCNAKLRFVIVPDNVTAFGDAVFVNSAVTLVCSEGSAADLYATANGIPVRRP